jgi:sterol desaturase/sphingolipid hydroxylase (fatty acid hydroxylase superfamily)
MLQNFPKSLINLATHSVSTGLMWLLLYVIFFSLYRFFNIHQKFGIFKVQEPKIHYQTALQNWKIPFFWGIGITLITYLLGLNLLRGHPSLSFEVPEQLIFLHSLNLLTDIIYAIIGFYLIDLTDYWAHRLNHRYQVLYDKFPVAHFVHHNCVYLNPMVVTSSPPVHLAAISGMLMYLLYLSQGLYVSVALLHVVKILSNYLSHLGCDPLPWLTRLNHRVGGWIPWIPLHHQYHHLPFVQVGNYGNVTCLWDYVFGTLIPECTYHIETGKPTAQVVAKIKDIQEISEFLKGKTSLSL